MVGKLIPFLYVAIIAGAAYQINRRAFVFDGGSLRRLFWALISLSLCGYLVGSYWLFVILSPFLISALLPSRSESDAIIAFLFLLPVLPMLGKALVIGPVSLMYMTWPRLLVLVLLLPLLPRAMRIGPLFRYTTDKYVLLFLVLTSLLMFRDVSFTAGIRATFYQCIDYFVPYAVLSRLLRTPDQIRMALTSLVVALSFVGLINIFETIRHWHVYGALIQSVTGSFGTSYETRIGLLRAYGPMDKPSACGFAFTAAIGSFWAISDTIRNRGTGTLILFLLALGLLLTFSRGSWVGAIFLGTAYLMLNNARVLVRFLMYSFLIAIPLAFVEFDDRIVEVLPFIGSETGEAARTVDYREDLLSASISVANENPLFGTPHFSSHPNLQALQQASGLVDIVNHFMLTLLTYGYIGLALFIAIFSSTIWGLRKAAKQAPKKISTQLRALSWTILALLIVISTTSAVDKVGLILWCIVGISIAASAQHKPRQKSPLTNTHWLPNYQN